MGSGAGGRHQPLPLERFSCVKWFRSVQVNNGDGFSTLFATFGSQIHRRELMWGELDAQEAETLSSEPSQKVEQSSANGGAPLRPRECTSLSHPGAGAPAGVEGSGQV